MSASRLMRRAIPKPERHEVSGGEGSPPPPLIPSPLQHDQCVHACVAGATVGERWTRMACLCRRNAMPPPTTTVQHPPAPQRWCDTIRATLASAFVPARTLQSWVDPPTLLPGFQVRVVDAYVLVRYVQPCEAGLPQRRARAHAMIAQYRRVLRACGWQVDVIDAPRTLPALRCWRQG